MTNEEIQQVLESIIKQQGHFISSMEKAEARMSRMESAFINAVNIISEMVKMQRELLEAQKDLVAMQKLLAEGGRATEERVNTLINAVERLISEGRDEGYIN